MIQGKQIAMHYSNPRPKFEDWLCNKVRVYKGEFLLAVICLYSTELAVFTEVNIGWTFPTPSKGKRDMERHFVVEIIACKRGWFVRNPIME